MTTPAGMPGLARLLYFIKEREVIRVKKERGDPWPWTDDPILRAYRFCNVRREDDKQTRLIHAHWLHPHADDPDLWFAMAVARLVNWWPSLEGMGYPVPWSDRKINFVDVLRIRHAAGLKVFTGAYMVRADPHVSGLKSTYLADKVLDPMWHERMHIRPRRGDTLDAFHTRLMRYKDMGPFISGQIVADAKWGEGFLADAEDIRDWATPGPGSLRGLNRLQGRHHDYSWVKKRWQVQFAVLLVEVRKTLPSLDGQNLQNCLCEYDKYERVRLGQGKPRSRYNAPSAPQP